jgi:hypothetical protein
MENKGKKLVVKILNSYVQKYPEKFNNLSEKQKIDILRKELLKYGLYIQIESKEVESFYKLKKLHDKLSDNIDILITKIGNTNRQTKLARFALNINSIVESYVNLDNLFNEYKENLKPFQALISKYVKKIPKSQSKSNLSSNKKTKGKGKERKHKKTSKKKYN